MRNLCLTLIACVCASLVSAQTYPDYESLTVTDLADLLTPHVEDQISAKLTALKADTEIEFTVLTLERQSDYAPGIPMETFATGLFNHWGIGKAGANTGILLLVLRDDRRVRLELGAGFEREWDPVAQRIINNDILPMFRQDNYSQGILAGIDGTIADIAMPFAGGSAAPAIAPDAPSGMSSDSVARVITYGILAIVGAVFLAPILSIFRVFNPLLDRLKTCPQCGTRGAMRTKRKTLSRSTRSIPGSEEVITTCKNCDHYDLSLRNLTLLSSNISSTRSSGGFGGGRSGGGGGSGSW